MALSEVGTWGHSSSNASGVSQFSLRFATEAEGTGGFASSVALNPTYFPTNNDTVRQSFPFGQTVAARYVEFMAEDNFLAYVNDDAGARSA